MSDAKPEITITWWNDAQEFLGPGVRRAFETDLKPESFSHFVQLLGNLHEEPFCRVAEYVEGETTVAVATPKPENMFFESECFRCEEVIPKEEIHFEVEGEKEMTYLCKECFFSAPYEE